MTNPRRTISPASRIFHFFSLSLNSTGRVDSGHLSLILSPRGGEGGRVRIERFTNVLTNVAFSLSLLAQENPDQTARLQSHFLWVTSPKGSHHESAFAGIGSGQTRPENRQQACANPLSWSRPARDFPASGLGIASQLPSSRTPKDFLQPFRLFSS